MSGGGFYRVSRKSAPGGVLTLAGHPVRQRDTILPPCVISRPGNFRLKMSFLKMEQQWKQKRGGGKLHQAVKFGKNAVLASDCSPKIPSCC